jgi:RhtB (resistance to homoserine/threonine) family protein
MQDLLSWALIYLVFVGVLVSPGLDFLMVMRNSIGFSRRAGVFTSLGIMVGNSIHMAYCLAGIGLLIIQSPFLFNAMKWVGAGYLIYMGISAMRSKGIDPEKIKEANLVKGIKSHSKTDRRAFTDGLVCNLCNPKATMFWLALFSQMVDPSTPVAEQIIFCLFMNINIIAWFSFVAFVMDVRAVRRLYGSASIWIDRVFGGFFIALGTKLALLSV